MSRRAKLVAATAALVIVVGVVTVVAPTAAHASRRVDAPVLYRVSTRQRLVALSFDDGPDPRWTPQVLEMLQRYGARATFFDVGQNVVRFPALGHAELKAGNELADHTWSHPHLLLLRPQRVDTELQAGKQALSLVTGVAPQLFRPPYGQWDPGVRDAADDQGMRTVLWSVCLERFVDHQPLDKAVAEVLARVRPGSIILAHDGGPPNRNRSLAALPALLHGLAANGYRVVSVGELLQEGTRS